MTGRGPAVVRQVRNPVGLRVPLLLRGEAVPRMPRGDGERPSPTAYRSPQRRGKSMNTCLRGHSVRHAPAGPRSGLLTPGSEPTEDPMRIRTLTAVAALTIGCTTPMSPASADSRAQLVQLVNATFGPAAAHARRIVACESSWNPRARHHNRNGTTDHGLFQLNDGGTLQSLGLTRASALDPVANVTAAYRLYKRRGWRPWMCSGRRR